MVAPYMRAGWVQCWITICRCRGLGNVSGGTVIIAWLEPAYPQASQFLAASDIEKCPLMFVNVAPRYTQESTISYFPPVRVKTACQWVCMSVWKIMAFVFPRVTLGPLSRKKTFKVLTWCCRPAQGSEIIIISWTERRSLNMHTYYVDFLATSKYDVVQYLIWEKKVSSDSFR